MVLTHRHIGSVTICCLYIVYYVSVTKPTCPAFSAWMNTGAIRSMKVTGKAIMLCSYGININVMANLMLVQCVIASHAEIWTCQIWWKFYQELSVTIVHGTGPRRNSSVNSRSTICPIERRSCLPKRLL